MPHPANATRPTLLRVDSSGRFGDSLTRGLGDDLIARLRTAADLDIVTRDLAAGLPFVDEAWIDANFTAEDARSPAQRRALAISDTLVDELRAADIILIGAPIYNFGVPAVLKAWIDMIARARLTFRYTPDGPEGLLRGKKAYLIVASGGVAIDSDVDHATPYLRQALGFVGITDIEVIAADQATGRGEDAITEARARIAGMKTSTPPRVQAA